MQDVLSEELISLTQVSKIVGKMRGGQRPHYQTIWRWARRGVCGVKLETIVIGRDRFTTRQAIESFFERCTQRADGDPQTERTTSERQRAVELAEEELAAGGI